MQQRRHTAPHPQVTIKAATPEQLAEIEKLDILIKSHAFKINQPYITTLTIGITTLVFTLLVLREGSPFQQLYLGFFEHLASSSAFKKLDSKLIFQNIWDSSKEQEYRNNLKILNEKCLAPYKEVQQFLERKSINDPNMVENLFLSVHKQEGFSLIRQNCQLLCKSYINSDVPFVVPGIGKGLLQKLSTLSFSESFNCVDKIADAISYRLREKNLLLTDDDSEQFKKQVLDFFALNKKTIVFNIFKIILLGISERYLYTPLINSLFPNGIRQPDPPALPQGKKLLENRETAHHITILKQFECSLKKTALNHEKVTQRLYIALAMAAVIILCTYGFAALPAELAFFLISTTASISYLAVRTIKNSLRHAFLENELGNLHNVLKREFNDISINLAKSPAYEVIQFTFDFQHHIYREIKTKDALISLRRCLMNYGFDIISVRSSKESTTLIFSYSPALSHHNILKIKQHINNNVKKLQDIRALSKELNKLQQHLITNKAGDIFKCDKYFDAVGFPSATYYLLTNHLETATAIQTLFSAEHCSLNHNEVGDIMLTLQDSSLVDSETVYRFTRSLSNRSEPPLAHNPPPLSPASDASEQRSRPNPKLRQEYGKPQPTSLNPQSSPAIKKKSLPAPYQNARQIKSSFLPRDGGHVWALFSPSNREQFPTQTCYDSFERLFVEPTIGRSKNFEGLVHDREESTPNKQRLKGKLLGAYGMYRLKAPTIVELEVDGTKEKVHVFSELILH